MPAEAGMIVRTVGKSNRRCHVCGAEELVVFEDFGLFSRVTSDCRPWPKGGALGSCRSCGAVQKPLDEVFRLESERIYSSYAIYHQGGGKEQKVFDQSTGEAEYRSEQLLSRVVERFRLPKKGRLLDFGCGNGCFLRSFSKVRPSWVLAGTELEDRYKVTVEQIKNIEALYTCGLEKIPGRFEMVSMLHSLEHIADPTSLLEGLRDKLNPGGLVLMQVPDYTQNPFDLLVADHCTHFDINTLQALLWCCGFEIIIASIDYIPKELSVLARKGEWARDTARESSDMGHRNAAAALTWLRQTVDAASAVASRGEFGIFGTAIAAMWLFAEMEDSVEFFVDEDLSRVGKELMGRPVYHPKTAPKNGNVFICMPFVIAKEIFERIKSRPTSFYLPPE